MKLGEVRRWAAGRGVPAAEFSRVHDGALLHVISRLLQAIYRESSVTRLWRDARGRWYLDVGSQPGLRLPASGPLPFRRLEILAMPRRIRTAGGFLRALQRALRGSEYSRVFAALRADFENSVANVTLNRVIGRSLGSKTRALEPAYQGHQYYPFPALRIGPSLSQVVECSHLCARPVALPLVDAGSCRLVTSAFTSYEAFFRAWSGLRTERGTPLLPVHPWQMSLSPVARELSGAVSARTVEAIPLASQRTCRVVRTGFDLKLPVDATVTGEHRLLYRLNCENAPAVSALARHVLGATRLRVLDFQLDIASMFHAEPALATHLSVIVRSPVRVRAGERVVPAINLWSGPLEARRLLRGAGAARIEEFFARYCGALMRGPVEFCAQWGIAFEPHLQNVYVALRDGLPSRIVLRDLDNSILDARRIRPLLSELRVETAKDTWRAMPAFEIGAKRMVQAMLFGHLGEVMWRLGEDHGIARERLAAIVEETWSELESRAPGGDARKSIARLRGWSDAVKATLRTRLHRSTTMEFVQEQAAE